MLRPRAAGAGSRGRWKKHEKVHQRYRCSREGCKRMFESYNELRKHMVVDHSLPLECIDCGSTIF
ncbi:hypothetical protein T11_1397 [Trichinella zimbabwensis]|uniref:C2H2-type domain-containing protein n=1 Tax=Trichinella zimbabwensis TaxID=268475 RepID=A0A0V1G8N9_9BILA|nr:hypothetical protein T11_1397 [Trichinella zimbabwensis]